MLSVEDTAFAIAKVRSLESARPEGERLFEDPLAPFVVAQGAHAREGVERFLSLPFFVDGIRLRTRFLDDVARDAARDGVSQLLLLGAGFDARAWRLSELRACRVFEVDLPAQVERKRALCAAAGLECGGRVSLLPCDLAAEDWERALEEALARAGFDPRAPSLCVWEGVTAYLPPAAIERCLRWLGRLAPGSRVAFDHGTESPLTEELSALLARAGFGSFERATGRELWDRYLPAPPFEYAAVFSVTVARR